MRSNGNPGSDERIVSIHGLRDFRNMSGHLSEEKKEERAEDHETRTDAAQVQGAYSA
jgi:hypothetical protein